MSGTGTHHFDALAFVDELPQRKLAETFPEARPRVDALHFALGEGGEAFLYPFGAVVFRDASRAGRDEVMARLHATWPQLATDVVREDFQAREEPGSAIEVASGALRVDRLTDERAAVIALTVAQSAAMETYERLVDDLFSRTRGLIAEFARRGSVPWRTRELHRFIASALANRNDVISVLHLLDKPDAVWSDPAMDRIYEDLRAEFDLADRWQALTAKLGTVQESLVLVLETTRDRRGMLLEAAIVALIVLEILFALLRIH